MAARDVSEGVREAILIAAEQVFRKVANTRAAEAWSAPDEGMREQFGRDVWIKALFGWVNAVNGVPMAVEAPPAPPVTHMLVDSLEIPVWESEIQVDSVVRAVVEQYRRKFTGRVPDEAAVARVLKEEYPSRVYRSAAGSRLVYARRPSPKDWSPGKRQPAMGADIPFGPEIERPEMWDLSAVERAVRDGFTFLLPFNIGESFYSTNAYWIGGLQAGASGLTMGPEHTPELGLLEDGWMWANTFFHKDMVSLPESRRAWIGEPDGRGVVKVRLEIDPDTVDWDLLNRGHQFRVPRGFL